MELDRFGSSGNLSFEPGPPQVKRNLMGAAKAG